MADAIVTVNRVQTLFVVNKYDDIDGSRVAQQTPRGRFCYRNASGMMVLPKSGAESDKAMYPVDWNKPLNPPPYFDGPGLNGNPIYPFDDGTKDASESTFAMDPDQTYQTPWPAAIKVYELPPALYGLPVTSGNRCLVYDAGTFTYGSGNYTGYIEDYVIGSPVYASNSGGTEGMLSSTAENGATHAVGTVQFKEVFGAKTVTVKLKGTMGL
jgi:hypothetical protein